DDAFLDERGFAKGSMRLLSMDEARDLYAAMGPGREVSGGSAANSMAGAAALGLSAAFVGQVAHDQLGAIFAHDMRSLGVRFETPPIPSPPPTGRCLILVTPDAQRTMSTFPGASHELTPAALDPDLIRSASVTFLEGYLWGPESPRAAMLKAADIAHSAGRIVAAGGRSRPASKPALSPQRRSSRISALAPKPTSESSRACEECEAPCRLLRLGGGQPAPIRRGDSRRRGGDGLSGGRPGLWR